MVPAPLIYFVIFLRSYNPEAPAPAKNPLHNRRVSSRSVKGYTSAPITNPIAIEISGRYLARDPLSKLGAVFFNSSIRIKTITAIDPDNTNTWLILDRFSID
jgi:hypothetical protein